MIPNRPEMRPPILVPGAVFGASFVIFSVINFDFDRLSTGEPGLAYAAHSFLCL